MDWCARDLIAGQSLFSATRLLLSNGEKNRLSAVLLYLAEREGLIQNAHAFLTLRASRASRSFQVAQSQLVEPCTRILIRHIPANIKKPAKAGCFIFGGERGIRTLDTL